jgi:hypothetical protein
VGESEKGLESRPLREPVVRFSRLKPPEKPARSPAALVTPVWISFTLTARTPRTAWMTDATSSTETPWPNVRCAKL